MYNTYSDHIGLFICMIIFSVRNFYMDICAACDCIDFDMVMIIINVYIQKYVQYLTYTDIYKRMIDNIASSKAMFVLGGHMI